MTAPAYLAPDWRYSGDDWSGANALTYVVYETAPVYASDGVTVVTPGTPQNLTGFTVSGTLAYQSRGCGPGGVSSVPAPGLAVPVGSVLNAAGGIISLSLPRAQTVFPRQAIALWATPGPSAALLLVQPRIVDSSGNAVTVGLQQLFVF